MVLVVPAFFSASLSAETNTKKTVGNYSSAAAVINGNQVEELSKVISAYERIAANGGWPLVSDDPELVLGQRHPGVRELRQRLRITADYRSNMGADPYYFDQALLLALQHFQTRHGLSQTTYLDRLTLRALNQPVEDKLTQLKHAQTAWAEIELDGSQPMVWVNIPEARVAALNEGRIVLNMRAIVGHPSRPTPTLNSEIKRVIANPFWSVPKSIAVADLLPKIQKDTGYLNRNKLKVYRGWDENAEAIDPATINWASLSPKNFPYRFLQDPGPSNSLGKLKFNFPNDQNVYLHDTPGQSLLGLSYRTLSSGCVRLAQPEALAEWLLPAKSKSRLSRALNDTTHKIVGFKPLATVPIALVYILAWVSTDDGSIQFRNDIYGQLDIASK